MKKIIIIAILITAFFLRIAALTYAIPQDVFGDELVHVLAAFTLLEQKTVNASFPFYYTAPLMSYILAPMFAVVGVVGMAAGWFSGISAFREHVLLNRENFISVLRLVSVLFSIGGLWIFYLLTRRIFNEKIAVASLFFAMGNFWLVHESQIGHFWVPALFFALVACYAMYEIYQGGGRKWYILCGTGIGLGYAMGYWPALLLPWFLLAHVWRQKKIGGKIIDRNAFAGCMLLAFFLVLSSLANTAGFVRQFGKLVASFLNFFGFQPIFLIPNALMGGTHPSWLSLFEAIFFNSPVIFFAAVAGFLLLWRKRSASFEFYLVCGFPLLYYAISSIIHTGADRHYVIPMLPFFDIAAGIFLTWLVYESQWFVRYVTNRRFLFLAGMLLFASLSLYTTISYALKIQHRDTRLEAIDWIYGNVPAGAKILMAMENMQINKNKNTLLFVRQNMPSTMNSRDRFLLSQQEEKFPQPDYFVLQADDLAAAKIDPAYAADFDYYIFEFFDQREHDARLAYFPGKKLVAQFYPRADLGELDNILKEPRNPLTAVQAVEKGGPYVEIYSFEK